MDLTAIDVLLDPDETMVGMAMAANARLRAVFPGGFALDGDHAPHITIIQRFVRSAELGAVETAVAGVVQQWNPGALQLEATGMYFLSWEQLGVPGITVAPTPELLALQQALIDAVAPFTEPGGDAAAFVGSPDTPTIVPTAAYVEAFVPAATGANYNPHVTVGVAPLNDVEKFVAAPFENFSFGVQRAAIYQLGDLGTAQKQLWSSTGGRA
jgi:hypothetical protein